MDSEIKPKVLLGANANKRAIRLVENTINACFTGRIVLMLREGDVKTVHKEEIFDFTK